MQQGGSWSGPGVNMTLRRGCITTIGLRHLVQPAVWPTLVGHQQAHSTAAAAARAAGAAAESSSRSRRPTSRSAPATADPATTSTSSHNSSSSSSVIQPQRVALSDQTASDAAAGSSARTLMIVESPTKATKIQKFLGSSYKVIASYGHVRDLASKSGSVKPHEDFSLVWDITNTNDMRLKDIAAATAGCRSVVLATDPDREGEAISWHVTEELKRRGVLPRPGLSLQRVTFTEVTQKAVLEALQQPRQISAALVDAYLARRALDYLVGYSISPVLWRKLGPAARSAGRVQSVALRLVCEREDAIQLFRPREYWSISADFSVAGSSSSSSSDGGVLTARLSQADGSKIQQMSVQTQQQADSLVSRLWQQHQQPQEQQQQQCVMYSVVSVVRKPAKRNPPPPFVTSTLQQEAARRFGFSASKTMQVAQQLYEGANTGEGLITYMRTDGVNISSEAVELLRDVICHRYGAEYLPASGPRVYKSRAKNAQEAHEAIRPTNPDLAPNQVSGTLTSDQAKLYGLIWRRAVASQMESAELQQVHAELQSPCGTLLLRSSGSSLVFPGYQAVWAEVSGSSSSSSGVGQSDSGSVTEGDDDVASGTGSVSEVLGRLVEGQQLFLIQVNPAQHFTKPPPRFSEATMVKALEEAGVGRPSTYAPIIKLLQDRGYVIRNPGRALVPTPLGRLLSAYLALHFGEYVDMNFTAEVEEQLDEVSAGNIAWKQLMHEFYQPFETTVKAAEKHSTSQVFTELERHLEKLIFTPLPAAAAAAAGADDTEADSQAAAAGCAAATAAAAVDPRVCPVCGGRLVLKPSRASGGFIGCSNHDILGCTFGRPLWPDAEQQLLLSDEEDDVAAAAAAADGSSSSSGAGTVIGSSKLLGVDPATGKNVWVKRGPYGLYVQLGDDHNPAAAAAAAGTSGSNSNDKAISSSSSSSKVKKQKVKVPGPPRASLPMGYTWSSVDLEAALQLLALPRMVGTNPESGEPITANLGRYGPYIRHKTLFVNLPKEAPSVQEITLDEALQLVNDKEAKVRARGRDPYAVKAKPSKPGRKAAASSSSSSGASSSKPKRVSGYNLYFTDMKDQLAAAAAAAADSGSSSSGGGGKGSMFKDLAAAWKALSQEQKAVYAERARILNEAAAAAGSSSGSSSSSSRRAGTRSRSTSGTTSDIVGQFGDGRRSYSTSRGTSSTNSSSSTNDNSISSSTESKASSRSRSRRTSTVDTTSSSSSSTRSRRSRSSRTSTDQTTSSSSTSNSSSNSSSRRRPATSLTGYQWFCKQQHSVVAAQNPDAMSSEVLGLLAAAWRGLSGEQQQEWSRQAAAAAVPAGR